MIATLRPTHTEAITLITAGFKALHGTEPKTVLLLTEMETLGYGQNEQQAPVPKVIITTECTLATKP